MTGKEARDFYTRRDKMAAEIELRMAEGDLMLENGWLVEIVHTHTCGTGVDGHYGLHEPGCGRVPVFDVAAAMVRNADEAEAQNREWGVPVGEGEQ